MQNNLKALFKRAVTLLSPPDRRRAVGLLFYLLIATALETLNVGLVVPVLALLTQADYLTRFPEMAMLFPVLETISRQTLVIWAMLTLVGAYALKTLFLAFVIWKQAQFSFRAQTDLSHRLFRLYLHQPYTFHLQRNSAQLIRNVTIETSTFSDGLFIGFMLLSELAVMLGLSILLLTIEPLGASILIGILGATGVISHLVTRRRIMEWGQIRQHHDGMRIQHLQQGLGSAKEIKLLGREANFLEQFSVHNVYGARAGRNQAVALQLPRLWLELLAITGLAALVLTLVSQGRTVESIVPTLGLFAAAAFRLMPSLGRIVVSLQGLQFRLPTVNVLHDDLQHVVPPQPVSKLPHIPFAHNLEICHLTYAYPDTTSPVLNDVSLSIKFGESVGFVGGSGSGKSTLVDLIMGLLTPQSGQILVDGKDISSSLRFWQNQIGYVPQNIYLVDDTLRRNIAFGIPDDELNGAAVLRALEAAQLDEFVHSLPEGLDTLVGEHGVRLSGGQRQRIGIARALYHDPSVLVMDEATSALDSETESGVIDAVTALRGSKTIFIIAHRLSTIEHCDRRYRVEQGAVIQE